jgi:hypothetical protein
MILTCYRHGTPARAALALGLPIALALLVTGLPRSARADEEDDIQRQIDSQKAGVPDLEHLDRTHAAASEIQRLRDWLGTAWDLRNKHEPDEAREVLERCMAQAELVRQVISTAQLKAQVAERETKLENTKTETDKKRRALMDAQVKKKSLETVNP